MIEYPNWQKQLIKYDLEFAVDCVSYMNAVSDYLFFDPNEEEAIFLRNRMMELIDDYLFNPGFYQILEMMIIFPDDFVPFFMREKWGNGLVYDFRDRVHFYKFNKDRNVEISLEINDVINRQQTNSHSQTESSGFWNEFIKDEIIWGKHYYRDDKIFMKCFNDEVPNIDLLEKAKRRSVKADYLWLKMQGVKGEEWFLV